jgi:glycyl-tRNA synthetase
MTLKMEHLVTYAKTYGFVYQGSEIYGGLSNTWDYGPLGVELKNALRSAWWQRFVQEQPNIVGLDSAILMNPKTWEASGHVGGFSDPLIDCKQCKTRHRADHLIEQHNAAIEADGMSEREMESYIQEHEVPCPVCGKQDFTTIRQFELMFKTQLGAVDDKAHTVYLRPETAQGIFVNFKNVQRTTRQKVPFGIAQAGKSFRNEITPGNFIFRTREFEQLELEFFCAPGTEKHWFDHFKSFCVQFLTDCGIHPDALHLADHAPEKLSHYSNATTDIEYRFPWGFDELWGLASRTDFDLTQHQTFSQEALHYQDPVTNEKYLPYVIEPSLGLDRLFLAVLSEAYHEEDMGEEESRIVLKLHPFLAPTQIAVFPLMKKNHREASMALMQRLAKRYRVAYDEAGNIGRRYRRQDAVGTPFVITIDDETLSDQSYTVRDRDTMQQVRLNEKELFAYFEDKITF